MAPQPDPTPARAPHALRQKGDEAAQRRRAAAPLTYATPDDASPPSQSRSRRHPSRPRAPLPPSLPPQSPGGTHHAKVADLGGVVVGHAGLGGLVGRLVCDGGAHGWRLVGSAYFLCSHGLEDATMQREMIRRTWSMEGGGNPALVSVGAEVGALRAPALTRTLLPLVGEYVSRLHHYLFVHVFIIIIFLNHHRIILIPSLAFSPRALLRP